MPTTQHLPEWAQDNFDTAPEGDDEAHSDTSVESEGHTERCSYGLGLKLFQSVEVATIVSAAILAFANAFLLVTSTSAARSLILRLYVISLCLIVGSSELNISSVIQELALLENWFCRGLSYGFVAMLTLSIDENDIRSRGGQFELVEVTEFYSAIFLFICGLIYCGMGITCRKQVKELMLLEQKLSTDVSPELRAPFGRRGIR